MCAHVHKRSFCLNSEQEFERCLATLAMFFLNICQKVNIHVTRLVSFTISVIRMVENRSDFRNPLWQENYFNKFSIPVA